LLACPMTMVMDSRPVMLFLGLLELEHVSPQGCQKKE
jgi:hypothetical protein